MKDSDGSWYVYGIVSYGLSGECGNISSLPGINTRVTEYLNWIHDGLEEY